jgi:transcriptional antiterminator RfaH
MDWFCDIQWFAVHVKRFRETVAASSVRALGLEAFLPMIKVDCPEREVIRVGAKALFPGYFFARFSPAISLEAVEGARGVLQVIKSGTLPIPIEDQVVQEIQNRVEMDGLIRLAFRELQAGDRVSIQEGPFAGMMGRVEAEVDDRKRVAILLESLWDARVLIERQCLEVEAV